MEGVQSYILSLHYPKYQHFILHFFLSPTSPSLEPKSHTHTKEQRPYPDVPRQGRWRV